MEESTLMNALYHTWAEPKIMGDEINTVCSFSVLESSMTTARFAYALWTFMCHVSKPHGKQILLSTNLQMPKCQVILIHGENDANVYLKEILFFCFL